jgi:hypothetical protein
MNYWDIRKRARLNHLPAPDPELVRAGVNDRDQNYLRSRRWMELYHEMKKEPPDVKITQESRDALMADADASSEDGTTDRSEAAAGAGGEFAPR